MPFVSLLRSRYFRRHTFTPEDLLEDSFDLSSLLGEFRDEARDQLDRLDGMLLAIEESGSVAEEDSTALLRDLHTLKGNSGMLGLRPIVDAVHAIEGAFKADPPDHSRNRLDLLFEAAAAIRQAIERAGGDAQEEAFARLARLQLADRLDPGTSSGAAPEADAPDGAPTTASPGETPDGEPAAASAGTTPGDAPATSPPSQSAPRPPADALRPEPPRSEGPDPETGDTAGEFLRVPFAKLDQLLDQVGELTSVTAALDALQERLEEPLEEAGAARPLSELVDQLGRVARALRASTMDARLVPVQRVFSRFPSLARDLGREQGKRVRVMLEGGETELDRSMVEALGDPLLHLVRNAVDHGIRTPEERTVAGRPATGTIVLRAERLGDRVRVTVADDGAGLDLDALRARGRSLGLLGRHSESTAEQAADLIFLPGFSTRASSDTISGRGIGLDAVRQRVAALRGTLSVESPPEGGTRFALDLPLTLAILPALVFEIGGGTFAIPASSVERTVRGATPEMAGTAEVLRHEGSVIPVARAERVFGWHDRSDGRGGGAAPFAVVVRSGARRGAVLATRLLDQRDLVVKALPQFIGRVPAVSGASIAPDGGVILLLDPAGLLDLNLAMHQRENRAFIASQDPGRRG